MELQIATGCHKGIRQKLPVGTYTIGRSAETDITLCDQVLDPIQARVTIDRAALVVERLAGSVVLNNRPVAGKSVHKAQFPAHLVLNGIRLQFVQEAAKTFAFPAQSKKRAIAAGGLVAIAIIVATVVSAGSGAYFLQDAARSDDSRVQAQSARAGGLDGMERRNATSSPTPAGESVVAAAARMRDRLASAGLRTIDISTESGVVIAKGSVEPQAVAAWYSAREWFDQTFGTSLVLTSQVDTRASPSVRPPLAVQAIWAGHLPYVIDERGRKYFVGSLVDGGWSIKQIDQGNVTLLRSGEIIVLRL